MKMTYVYVEQAPSPVIFKSQPGAAVLQFQSLKIYFRIKPPCPAFWGVAPPHLKIVS
jgi:hypothetical protein